MHLDKDVYGNFNDAPFKPQVASSNLALPIFYERVAQQVEHVHHKMHLAKGARSNIID